MSRKSAIFIITVLFLSFSFSCCSDNETNLEGYTRVDKIKLDILPIGIGASQTIEGEDEDDDSFTRSTTLGSGEAIIPYFEYGDTMGIFPDRGYQIPFILPLQPGELSNGVQIEAQGWMTKDSLYYSVYLPFDFYNRHYNRIPHDYRKILYQTGVSTHTHLSENMFMASDTTLADSGLFHAMVRMMGAVVRARVRVKDAGNYVKLVVVAQTNAFATHGYYDLFDTPEDNGQTPTNNQPFLPEGTSNFIVLYLGAPDANGVPAGISRNASGMINAYYMIPEADVQGQTLTCYIWTDTGICYTATSNMTDGVGNFARNTVTSIVFENLKLTTTPDVYVYPYRNTVAWNGVALGD